MKRLLALVLMLLAYPAQAQIFSSYPFTFQNGTVIDATQVNANFNAIGAAVNVNAARNGLNGDITGLTALASLSTGAGTFSGNVTVGGTFGVTGVVTFAADAKATGTGQWTLPVGTTAQRSGTPANGMIRYNTTLNSLEGYNGNLSSWLTVPMGPTGFCEARGLKITNDGVTPNSKIALTADAAQLATATGSGQAVNISSVVVSINDATSGANGLDTGSIAPSTWYHVWLINNGTTTAGLLSLSATAPTLPAGYIYACREGAMRTDGASILYRTLQAGTTARYVVTASTNTASMPLVINFSSSNNSYTSVSMASFAPLTAARITLTLAGTNVGDIWVAPNANYGANTSTTNPPPIALHLGTGGIYGSSIAASYDLVLEGAFIYYANYLGGASTEVILTHGWTDNVVAF